MIRKTTRSILSVLLAALLLVTSIPLTPAFADGGAVSQQSESAEGRALKGDGTADDPYKIATAADLLEFADKVNNQNKASAWAELTADIDLSNQRWTPIGNSIGNSYRGTFNGAGHTISGLYIDRSDNDQGLFGYVSGSGKIEKLSVSGNVSGNDHVGGVVGQNLGTVTNCAFSGSVSGSDHVGGVVGYNNSSVENCYNTGSVHGSIEAGGVVGYNGDNVENCYNIGEVSGSNVGGVVGYNNGSVKNCYNTGKVTGSSDYSYIGGVVGYNRGTVTGCYFLKDTAKKGIGSGSGSATPLTADEFADQSEFSSWDFANTWEIKSIFGRPTLKANAEIGGTANNPYKIFTDTQLKNFAVAVNTGSEKSAHAKLMNNIDLNGNELDQWTPIGNSSNEYSGTFNGDGHTISGLYIDSSDTDYQGLFGFVGSEGTVQNLSVSGSVSGNNYVGGVVGDNRGSVEDCDFTGSVTGTVDYVGGVVGYNGGTVKNCYNTGNISGNTSGNQVGGIVGQNSGTVENCYNTGNISGDISIGISGGVVGWNDSGTVKNCYNTGNISSNTSGGVVGCNSGIVENCYNIGKVSGPDSGTGNRVGGVVGYNDGSFTNCYFLQGTAGSGIGKNEGSDTATEKDDTAFHSGEVAYLLQSKQTAEGEGEPALVWGQSALGTEDSLPTLVALNPGAAKEVYQLTLDWSYDSATHTTNVYTNDSVTFPSINHDRDGYHISGWKDKNGQPVTAGTTVSADTTYYAQWTENTYGISATPDTLNFASITVGGAQPAAQNVTITNSGNQTVTLTQLQSTTSFEVSALSSLTLAPNATATFTVQPKAGLAAGSYSEEITITGSNDVILEITATLTVSASDPTPSPDPTPSGPSTGDSTGWADILDELENAENGDQITIDMGDETEVPAEIFESLAGKEVEVIFDLGDVQWSASGETIPTDTDFTDLDLGVALGTSGIPVNVINTITGEVGTVQITLAHNGEFGFTLTLTAPLGKENAGYWANLYHFDESAEAMNFEAAAKIDETGSVTIPFSHASQYAIVIDDHSHARVDVSDIFVDVAPDAWYTAAIQYAYDNGLMTGVSDTEFAPEQTTTRAMIVSILARLENVTTAEAAGFADVSANDWYATAVNWAASVGVVNGYEDNTFRPNTAITREQLAAILMNYAAYKGYDVSARADLSHYSDADSISSWANDVLLWAVAEGLLTGVTDDTIAPQAHATRAQVAAILQRFLSE